MAGLIVLILVLALVVVGVAASQSSKRRREEEQLRAREERRRVEACGEVVLFFANHLGHVARDAISREELGGLIDGGIGPEALAGEIRSRIGMIPGVVLGHQAFDGCEVEVKLTPEHRARHLYVVGKSGSGKTNLLRNLIFQDLEEGHGLGVIAPEQEMLTEEILPYVPDHRLDDVIYFNPADADCPVSFNPLHLDEGEDLDLKVDENLTVFKRVVGETGPRMEEILRQALYALVGRPGATLLDVERLLDRSDPTFRNEVVRTSAVPEVIHFWRDVYPGLPRDAHLPITNRLGRFLRPKFIRSLLCQPGRGLDFRRAMDEGKVMLFNLSDGILGEQNSQFLGQLVVSKFQLAVMGRAGRPKAGRRPFYLYVDEFQTFTGTAGASYEKMLSRARKYGLGLVLAHQQTGQIPAGLLKEILGNVSTSVCFLVSREDALRFSRELVTLYDGEVLNVPEEEILRLKVGQAWCKVGQHAFLLQTRLADQRPDRARALRVIERARRNYGTPVPAGHPAQGTRLPAPSPDHGGGKAPTPPRGKTARSPVDEALDGLDPADVFGR